MNSIDEFGGGSWGPEVSSSLRSGHRAELILALGPTYRLGDNVFLSTLEAEAYLRSGFSFREEWGRWTDGPRACFELAHGEAKGLLLVEMSIARAFCAQEDICDLIIEAGWGEPRLFTLGAGPARIAFLVPAEETYTPGTATIVLHVVRPKSPNQPPDARSLGVGIESVRVEHLGEAGL